MYCLIRKDLASNHQAVQGGHAIAQYFLDHGKPSNWDNGTMIFLGVKDKYSLEKWRYKLRGLKYSSFIEPDMGNEITALSIIDNGKMFTNLSLLR